LVFRGKAKRKNPITGPLSTQGVPEVVEGSDEDTSEGRQMQVQEEESLTIEGTRMKARRIVKPGTADSSGD